VEAGPALAGIEVAEEGEQVSGGGVEVGRELGDLVADPLEVGGGREREGKRHR
jgi:hypothetical protein